MSFNRLPFTIYIEMNSRSGRQRKVRLGAPGAASLAILALVGILCVSTANAQQKRGEPVQERPDSKSSASESGNANVFIASDEDYRISAGDVIQIHVEDAPELSHSYRVSSSGRIEMPVLGLVAVQKKTTYELARLIAKGLREGEYLKTPNVMITIAQYYSQTFLIQGSVQKPGVFQLEGRPSLLTMITMAGGLENGHGSTAFILRPKKTQKPQPDPDNQISSLQDQTTDPAPISEAPKHDSTPATDYDLIRVNIGALYKGQADQRLEPGDIVNIPRADVFFVAGEVKAPGSFPLKEGTTLRQAISLAQGMTFSAKSAQGIIFREDPLLGSRREIKVDVRAVMDGKKDDIPVQANDVIIVPNSRGKSIGGALLMALGVNSARLPMRY